MKPPGYGAMRREMTRRLTMNMHKGTYWLCGRGGRGVRAKKVEGYINGDVGLRRTDPDGNVWTATHIPTGLLLCRAKTMTDAYATALRMLAGFSEGYRRKREDSNVVKAFRARVKMHVALEESRKSEGVL